MHHVSEMMNLRHMMSQNKAEESDDMMHLVFVLILFPPTQYQGRVVAFGTAHLLHFPTFKKVAPTQKILQKKIIMTFLKKMMMVTPRSTNNRERVGGWWDGPSFFHDKHIPERRIEENVANSCEGGSKRKGSGGVVLMGFLVSFNSKNVGKPEIHYSLD